jgi:hypothetical protein
MPVLLKIKILELILFSVLYVIIIFCGTYFFNYTFHLLNVHCIIGVEWNRQEMRSINKHAVG